MTENLKKQIEKLVADGVKYAEIARQLNISGYEARYYGDPKRRKYVYEYTKKHRKIRRAEGLLRFKQEAGGKCQICGYNKCLAALHFHHKNPAEKRHTISQDIDYISTELIREEVKKCMLVCANCHAELTWPHKNVGLDGIK